MATQMLKRAAKWMWRPERVVRVAKFPLISGIPPEGSHLEPKNFEVLTVFNVHKKIN
jgi:hypothetical protein